MSDENVYGDVLSAFSELMNTYIIFSMRAKAGGGFGPRTTVAEIDGVFRNVPGGKMGVVSGNLEANSVNSFWCYAEDGVRIRQGSYVEIDGDIYKLAKDNSYRKEAGFVKFTASLVPGPTDKQLSAPEVIVKAKNGFE